MKPRQAEPTPYIELRSQHFNKTVDEWELNCFDEAILFTVLQFKGRGTRQRFEYASFPDAVKDCQGRERSCLYAVTSAGRAVCVEQAKWPSLLLRWHLAHGTLRHYKNKSPKGACHEDSISI